jgi:hypothetical protein
VCRQVIAIVGTSLVPTRDKWTLPVRDRINTTKIEAPHPQYGPARLVAGLGAFGGTVQPFASAYFLQLAVSTLPIQRVGSFVFTIDLPKQPLKLCDLCLCDIRPNDEGREMSPQGPFSFAVGVCPKTSPYSCFPVCHSHINDVVFSNSRPIAVQGVDSSESCWHGIDSVLGNPLSTTSDQA